MANQGEFRNNNNARPPVNVSADPPWIDFPNVNWGASVSPFSVQLDPQVNVRRDVTAVREPGGLARASMKQLMREFADWNDDLLDELAR